jgi:hypothetical protein
VIKDLSWEVKVENGQIKIPTEYVELCEIGDGYSFEIKIGRKRIMLEISDEFDVRYDDDQYETREDGKNYLKYLTQTNYPFDKSHVIPSVYVTMEGDMREEGDKFYIRVAKKRISLLSAKYYDSEGQPLESDD